MSKKTDSGAALVGNGAQVQFGYSHDFAFIASSLGLFAINGIAFSVGAIGLMEATEKGAMLVIHGGIEIELSHEQLAEIERAIKARIEAMERAKNVAGKSSDLIIPNFTMKGQ